jgi:prepilin-type N-terminal cleavage/methylation domain-containing protein
MKPTVPNRRRDGFSLAELLVAAAIGAAVLTATAIGFAVISGASTRGGRVDVQLPDGTHARLYGGDAPYITVWPNPGYAEAAKARLLRDKLVADASSATAVFCLGRNQEGGVRPSAIVFDAGLDFREIATPGGFRQFLIEHDAAESDVFAEDQSGRLETANATIFVVGGLETQDIEQGQENSLRMVATYEVDFVPTTTPPGVYASVRRYDADDAAVPTDYYHAFYPDEDNGADGFRPLAVHFGRVGLGGPYNIAPNHPYTFVWWPDPLVSRLGGVDVPAEGGAPLRSAYANMAGRTSLFTVLPTFPGQ